MMTMVDEIFDRGYQSGRAELHAGIDRLIARIGSAFKAIGPGLTALNRLEWTAPWDEQPKPKA
jgi:hypothetical protein